MPNIHIPKKIYYVIFTIKFEQESKYWRQKCGVSGRRPVKKHWAL